MPKTTRKPPKSSQFLTLTAFAAGLKIPVSTLHGWIKNPGWTWSKKAPWPKSIVAEVQKWTDANLDKRGGRPALEVSDPQRAQKAKNYRDLKLRQEIRKLRAQADQAETALARERSQLHDAEECELEAVRRASLFRNAVQNLPSQIVSLALANGMPHESSPQVQRQIERLVHGCLKQAAAAADEESEAGNRSSAPHIATARIVDAE